MPAPPGTKAGIGTGGLGDRGYAPGGSKHTGGGTGLGAGGYQNRYSPRYEKKKTKSFAPTASNLAQIAGTVLGALGGPIGTALNMGANAISGVDPMNPFERPTGMVDTFSYDPTNRALGQEQPGTSKLSAAKRVTKKRAPKFGFTLLEGAGGVLSGS